MRMSGPVSGVVWQGANQPWEQDQAHDEAMRVAWHNPTGLRPGDRVLVSLSNGFEEWAAVIRTYRNRAVRVRLDSGRRTGNYPTESLWLPLDGKANRLPIPTRANSPPTGATQMARPRNPDKTQTASVMDIAAAMAADNISLIKGKKVSRGAIDKAIALAKGFNQRFKTPDAFVKLHDSIPEGRGGVGRAPAAVGEERRYKLTKDRALVISLKAYDWAIPGGLAKVYFDKNGPVVSKG